MQQPTKICSLQSQPQTQIATIQLLSWTDKILIPSQQLGVFTTTFTNGFLFWYFVGIYRKEVRDLRKARHTHKMAALHKNKHVIRY